MHLAPVWSHSPIAIKMPKSGHCLFLVFRLLGFSKAWRP